MTVGTGRTHNKWISFWCDNSGGTLTDLTPYLRSVGAVGTKYDQQDVTAAPDGGKNYTVGWGDSPLSIEFIFDPVVLAHFAAISTVQPLSLDVRFGIRQTQVTGEPQFGISMAASTSGYLLTGLTVNQTESIVADFCVFGATAPAFGTTNET